MKLAKKSKLLPLILKAGYTVSRQICEIYLVTLGGYWKQKFLPLQLPSLQYLICVSQQYCWDLPSLRPNPPVIWGAWAGQGDHLSVGLNT